VRGIRNAGVIDSILNIMRYIWKVFSKLIPPIDVEVEGLYCQLIGSDPYQTVTVITAWSKRYRVDLLLINRRDSVVFLRDMSLMTGDGHTYRPTDDVTKISLEPRQALRFPMVFPIPDKDTPLERGGYELRVIPTSGRQTVVRGHFPTGDK